MGLFKSKDERRIEREMKIRQGVRAIEKSIRQQEKFADDFIRNTQHARKIGDEGQYQFIRNALKKTHTVKRMLERYADGPVAVLGTHFNHPTAGRILRHGDAWRFVAPA